MILIYPEKPYICCSDKDRSAYWSKIISKTNISFSCDELINSIDFIVNNSFITFHSLVYRQVIGIPMGTNCAPFLANVFLHVYEYEYLQKLVNQSDIETAINIAKTFKGQDD